MTQMTHPSQPRCGSESTGINRLSPFWGLVPFGSPVSRLLEENGGHRTSEEPDRLLTPLVEASQDERGVLVSAELPGLKKEDVRIQVEDGVLVISGEKPAPAEKKTRDWHRMERRYGPFYRAIALPSCVNPDKAEAEFQDGVLHIRLPLREGSKATVLKIK
jgi:HSP20 family protein